MKPSPDRHYRHRFPAEIISHAVWLYHVFSLSLRDVELILAQRGVVVSYETIQARGREVAADTPLAFRGGDFVAYPFADNLPLELGKREKHIQGQATHARGRIACRAGRSSEAPESPPSSNRSEISGQPSCAGLLI